jgi:hypothetical protein
MCVKFCFKLGKTAVETHRTLCQSYGDEVLSKTITYKWYKRFQSWKTSTDDERSGQPSTSGTETLMAQVKEVIQGNQWMAVQEVA